MSANSAAPSAAPIPSVRSVLERHAAAVYRTPQAAAATTLEMSGTLEGQGLRGDFHSWHDGEWARTDQRLGLRAERTLARDGALYYGDENGDVRVCRGVYSRRQRTADLIDGGGFITRAQYVTFGGSRTINGHITHVLEVRAPGGEPEWLYIDARTSLIDRVEYDAGDGTETIDFSDYREVDGQMFAFRAVASDGNHQYDVVETIRNVRLGGAIARSIFSAPRQRLIDLHGTTQVPLRERDGHLYAPVRIGTRTYLFLVDSGAQTIVLDRRVAREQHLRVEGALQADGVQRTSGLGMVRVPAMRIGDATLHDVVAGSLDLAGQSAGAFRIDGVLGYPFFAGAVVRIDAHAATMRISRPDRSAPEGTKLSVEMDRSFPEAGAVLDGVPARFVLDTGSNDGVLLYRPFVEAHPGLVPPTLDAFASYGVGGSALGYRTTLRSMRLGAVDLGNRSAGVMLAQSGTFADRFDAGNIGLRTLRDFVVTLDESRSAVYLQRTRRVSKR